MSIPFIRIVVIIELEVYQDSLRGDLAIDPDRLSKMGQYTT